MPAAGLNWDVESRPVLDRSGEQITGYQHLVRSDNEFSMGIVGSKYDVFQNRDAFERLMPLIETGEAEIETAGSLDNGKKVWALLRSNHLNESVMSNGERIRNFFLWSTSHDGSRSNRFGKTSVRVVCANTLSMSDRDSAVVFRHTNGQKHILDQLVQFAAGANQENENLMLAYEKLLATKCSRVQLEDYIKQVFALSDHKRSQNILNDIAAKADFGRGNREVRGTWWAALNAATEHLTHHAGKKDSTADNRYKQLWFGGNQGVLNKANVLAIAKAS